MFCLSLPKGEGALFRVEIHRGSVDGHKITYNRVVDSCRSVVRSVVPSFC